jgi:LuxR family transcriptional regulator, maltose regulon positive regulatory protein
MTAHPSVALDLAWCGDDPREALRAACDGALARAAACRRELAQTARVSESARSLLARTHQRLAARGSQAGDGARNSPAAGGMPLPRRVPLVPDREALLPDLTEPLTVWEQELLDLLARRFSSQEIATTLRISWQSVAQDTNTLYQKLRVTGRLEAVQRAAALGILPGPGVGAARPRLYVLPPLG